MTSEVTIYTTKYCPFCHAAKELLSSKGVKFREIDVTQDDAMRQKLVQMTGLKTVPQTFTGATAIGGYEDLVRYFNSGKTL